MKYFFGIEFSCEFIEIKLFLKVVWVYVEYNEGVFGGFKRIN